MCFRTADRRSEESREPLIKHTAAPSLFSSHTSSSANFFYHFHPSTALLSPLLARPFPLHRSHSVQSCPDCPPCLPILAGSSCSCVDERDSVEYSGVAIDEA